MPEQSTNKRKVQLLFKKAHNLTEPELFCLAVSFTSAGLVDAGGFGAACSDIRCPQQVHDTIRHQTSFGSDRVQRMVQIVENVVDIFDSH